MKKVRITKLSAVTNPICPPAEPNEFVYGTSGIPGKSLPIDYTVEGYLMEPITVGHEIWVDRRKRNDILFPGEFLTSRVVKVENNKVFTQNSEYLVEELSETDWR
jgi:hypothetical protein